MNLLPRVLRYLAPSKGKIMLVVTTSIMTSLLSVVSIYSILPLLNEVFTSGSEIRTGSPSPKTSNTFLQAIPVPGASVPPSGRPGLTGPGASVKLDGINKTEEMKQWALDKFRSLFSSPTKEMTLLKVCIFLIIAFAVKNIFLYLNRQTIFRIQTKTAKKLRDDVFSSMIEMHLDYFNKNRVGNLMIYLNNDVENVINSISATFINFLQNPFSVLVFVGVMLALSWQLTVFASSVCLVILYIINILGKKIKGHARDYQNMMGDMNSVLQEKFSGIKVIKSTAYEGIELDRFKSFTTDFRKLGIKINRLRNITSPMNETLLVAAVALVIWFGGIQVFKGRMTANELIVFAFSLFSTIAPIKMLGDANMSIQTGLISIQRLFSVLDTKQDVINGTKPISGFSGSIRFEDVCFRYDKSPGASNILDHVTFELKKGEMLALVGESGSGKSTIADLLLRFYDVDSGKITIDGTDIREYDYKQLRKIFGVVSQEVILFNDTIEQNIAYGTHGKIDPDRITLAAKLANAHGFIMEKPQQYQTLVGDRGVQLSGGQRQRIAIARAMVKNPEVLIFDEATSALDNESEKLVQQAIDHAMQNRTALVVAHRLSTIKNADRIIVMERGKVMESGNHQELLQLNGIYKKLSEIRTPDHPAESEAV
jgi:ATP-binding cassette, subfamily B, bacterial MsbA